MSEYVLTHWIAKWDIKIYRSKALNSNAQTTQKIAMILTLLKLRNKNQHSHTKIKIKQNITKFPEVVFNTLVY